ncbi:MAG: hypothetical protein IPK82_43120 [Polyangiaceae bacterium]|nr:hypothetical protein [Polyangiaceae bacterium]
MNARFVVSRSFWAVLGVSAGCIAALTAGCQTKDGVDSTDEYTSESGEAETQGKPSRCLVGDRASIHEGGAIRRGAMDEALYVAQEDAGVVRVLPLPLGSAPGKTVATPGNPAQVLPLAGCVLITVRDPGLLLVMGRTADGGLTEVGRVEMPADAWGVSVTPDERTALITSAWTHKVTAVDLTTLEKRFEVDVAREPRAVVVRPDGQGAYVTHLMGADVTRLDWEVGEETGEVGTANVSRVHLPAAPLSAPRKDYPITFELSASLAYSAVLSPNGKTLFIPRHALGGYGATVWYGRPTVDMLNIETDKPITPPRVGRGIVKEIGFSLGEDAGYSGDGAVPVVAQYKYAQPRDAVYRNLTKTLVVASEGHNTIVELEPDSLDPALLPIREYHLTDLATRNESEPGSGECTTPTGIALSEDESTAYVFCRSNDSLAVVALDSFRENAEARTTPVQGEIYPLGGTRLTTREREGKVLFYAANIAEVSGGLGCAGCHPEGRDDGHVWHEQPAEVGGMTGTRTHEISSFRVGLADPNGGRKLSAQIGYPRQTPMLAGRVGAKGPYAWHADARTLEERIRHGFGLHHWHGDPNLQWGARLEKTVQMSNNLAAFLREGLVPPPMVERDLTAAEQRGKEIFESSETGCSSCHFPATEYTDRSLANVGPRPSPEGFLQDARRPRFKTPSLLFVGGTAPYYHDGSAATLLELVLQNKDRMGKTEQLSPTEKADLAAYLETIGVVKDEWSKARTRQQPVKLDDVPVLASMLEADSPISWEGSAQMMPASGEELGLPKPSENDWKTASHLAMSREPTECEGFAIGDWVRVKCPDGSLVKLIVGSKESVSLRDDGKDVSITFRAQRGDKRLFVVESIHGGGRWWLTNSVDVVLSEHWPEDADAPMLTLQTRAVHKVRLR